MKPTTYHLRPSSTAAIALCGVNAPPERTVPRRADIPANGRLCLLCVRKLGRLPITQRVRLR